VEVLALDVEFAEFFGRHFFANWIAATVEPGTDHEPTAVVVLLMRLITVS
jgi:hypothetical protein